MKPKMPSPFFSIRFSEKEINLSNLEPLAKTIFDLLGENEIGLSIDKIAERIKDDLNVIVEQLTYLIFEGLIEEKNGKFIKR